MLLVACMGIATIVEKFIGKDAASEQIYGSWWFVSLWSVLAFLSLVHLWRRKTCRYRAVMCLHLSFLLILLGAFVTHLTSVEGTLHLRKGAQTSEFTASDGGTMELPFSVLLKEFTIVHYPGTDAVMDYQSLIAVKGDHAQEINVSMNHIGKVSGYRFYQSACDTDGQGVWLLVARDPYGIAITYAGYLMLLVGILFMAFSKRSHMRHLYRMATQPVRLLLLFLLLSVSTAKAADVNREIADRMGQIAVLHNGRICPLNTAATDFVTKLCGKSSWEGYSANEIFFGWSIFYTEWETRRIIKVKDEEVQKILGIDGKWASLKDFYTDRHQYKLEGLANAPDLPETTRKAIREADEKIQVIMMFYHNEMLRIFPYEDRGKLNWYAPGSTELPQDMPEKEFLFIKHSMDHLVKCILADDREGARTMVHKIRLFQKEKAGQVMPSTGAMKAEILCNSMQAASWPVLLLLACSLFFCILFFGKRSTGWTKGCHTGFLFLLAAYLTFWTGLRWWISGHVPMSNGHETMWFMAWLTMAFTLSVMHRMPVMKAFGPVVSCFCMLVAMWASGNPQVTQLMPVLQSPLLTIHVTLVIMAYAILAVLALIAVRCLISGEQLDRLTALSRFLLYPAEALLAMGIFIGAVWANVSWGTYWSWDPKETWALITLMVYAVPFHHDPMWSQKPGRYHLYILLSFLTVLMTYFGVNYFLAGMHSYA